MMPRLALLLALTLAASPAWGAAPIILYTDITSGPDTGGEDNNGCYLSIFGKNFGSDLGNVSVTVGGGAVAREIYLGQSNGRSDVQQLSVQIGSAAETGAIVVTVAGLSSNTDINFTVRPGDFYYVSASGNNSTGVVNDIAHPYLSVNYVIRDIGIDAGDTVVLRGGTYDLTDYDLTQGFASFIRPIDSGTATDPKMVIGYPGETVTFVVTDESSVVFGNYVTVAHWIVGNYEISMQDCNVGHYTIGSCDSGSACNDDAWTMDGQGNYIKIVNTEMYGSDLYGLCGGHDMPQNVCYGKGVKIWGTSFHNTSSTLVGTESSHEIYLATKQQDTDVGWNEIYNLPTTRAVIQIHQDWFAGACYRDASAITNIKIHDNIIHNVAGQPILCGGGTKDIYIYNNVVYDYPLADDHRYSEILSLRGDGGMLNARVYNNTLHANYIDGTYNGNVVTFGSVDGSSTVAATMYNNLFIVGQENDTYYGYNNGSQTGSTITSDYNIWYGSSSSVPTWEGAHGISSDPLWVAPASGNYLLQAASPAIGAGYNVGSPVVTDFAGVTRGTLFDIGAYEYAAGSYLGFGLGAGGSMAIGSGGTVTLQ